MHMRLSNLLFLSFGFVLILMTAMTVIGVINVNNVDQILPASLIEYFKIAPW